MNTPIPSFGHERLPVEGVLGHVPAQPPKPPCHPDERDRLVKLILVHQPGQGGAEVASLGLQPV
jgi:hypothetical protein